jgi:hypothetical protein
MKRRSWGIYELHRQMAASSARSLHHRRSRNANDLNHRKAAPAKASSKS